MKKGISSICLTLMLCLILVNSTFAGQIVAWGDNYYYAQCDVPAGSDFVAIATGRGNCIALKSDGSLLSWGSSNLAKQDVPPGNGFIAIAAGRNHYLVLKSDGSLAAWGGNYYGQSNVPAGNDFVAIAAGSDHCIALKADGSLGAWGDNYFGQCNVPLGNDFVDITASTLWQYHGLALKSDGSLAAWGRNNYGQCNAPAGNDFAAIAVGQEHSLALKSDGSLVAWGRNNYGQCDVPAGNDFVAITAGGRHGLAIKSNGSLVGWGRNDKGQCDVPAGNDFVAIATETYGSLALVSEPAILVRIEVVGPDDVRKNYQAQYKALAYYDDGVIRNATHSAVWRIEPNAIASIDTDGHLETGDISISEYITIFASYTEGGVTSETEKVVLISIPQILSVPTEYQTIQEAINTARYGDTVVIADGIYTGQGNKNIDFLGKAITVRSTDPNDSNIVAATIIDCNGTESDPHRGFYFHNGEDANSVLDGITITNGNYSKGGAIHCYGSSPTIINCILKENSAIEGGGIYAFGCIHLTIRNCLFTFNRARLDGGGLFSLKGGLVLTDCIFGDNSAGMNGGAVVADSSLQSQETIIIKGCTIRDNNAREHGGGLYVPVNSRDVTIDNCEIKKNSAAFGGALFSNSLLSVNKCRISQNSARETGGAMCSEYGGFDVSNCLVTANTAGYGGGAYSLYMRLINCSFCDNRAIYGGAIDCSERGIVSVENSILWNNTAQYGPQIEMCDIDWGSTLYVSYSDIEGGRDDIGNVGNIRLHWGEGNTYADPFFLNAGYWDPNGTFEDANDDFWVDGDYHLLRTSPCINTGDPCHPYDPNETDLDDNPRIMDGRIDMGAFEYLPPLEARLLIMPRTINRRNHQRHIIAVLSLPAGITKDDIDPNVPLTLYPGGIEASRQFIFENNRRGRTHTSIFAFFKKKDLMNAIPEDGPVQLEAVGQLNTGRYFFGQRTVRIINPPHRRPRRPTATQRRYF